MSRCYDLTKMYNKGQTITICEQSFRTYNMGRSSLLEHKVGNEWLTVKPKKPNYPNYEFTLCPNCKNNYMQELEETHRRQ